MSIARPQREWRRSWTPPPVVAPSPAVSTARPRQATRLESLDAYRGLVVFLMVAELCMQLHAVADAMPGSRFWQFVGHHQTHMPWTGASLHDLIHPSFVFLVGVALPYSLVRRHSSGQSIQAAIGHAAWRSLVLICLGIFLRSVGHEHTIFTFMDTLTLIGLAYLPLFLIGLTTFPAYAAGAAGTDTASRKRFRAALPWVALAVVLVGYWGAFALYPLPGPNFDYAVVGVDSDWQHHFRGFAAHWNKNSNLGWAFDRWFLNLFPRSDLFEYHPGGYSSLNFIPTLATMLLGLIAGRWLLESRNSQRTVVRFVVAGAVCLALAYAAHYSGVCPIVKRLWTPSWVLFAGAWAFWFLAFFHLTVDHWRWQAWALPLKVLGLNAMAAYILADLIPPFILSSLQTHLGADAFQIFGAAYEPALGGLAVLGIFWLIFYWMYRRRIFIKI